MNQYLINDGHTRYVRISKQRARAYFAEGNKSFCLCPNKLRPGYPWAPHMMASTENQDFDNMVRSFEWHNCSNEAGRYAAFYKVEEINN